MVDSPLIYPYLNLFSANVWTKRADELLSNEPKFYTARIKGFKAAFLTSGLLCDFEQKPQLGETDLHWLRTNKCDLIFYRKLLSPEVAKDPLLKTDFVLPYSVAPYLDLTKPLSPKKEPIAHIYRCERKLTREVGQPVLRQCDTSSERSTWFEIFSQFQAEQNRGSERQNQILKKWVLEGEKPPWMKLMSLEAGKTVLAIGLFYLWNGTFYYYSSAMNQDPELRKYGGGKLFVEKLILFAKNEGATLFDFLHAAHDYKYHWNPQNRPLYQYVGALNLKGSLAVNLFKVRKNIFTPAKSHRQMS